MVAVAGIIGLEEEGNADIKLSSLEPELNNYTDISTSYELWMTLLGIVFAAQSSSQELCNMQVYVGKLPLEKIGGEPAQKCSHSRLFHQ